MQFERVQCLVRVLQNNNPDMLAVSKSGPDAISVTEIPILRALNDIQGGGAEDCSVTQVKVVGSYETSNANEVMRLAEKYGRDVVQMMYPGGRQLPKTLKDCELPASAMAKKAG